MQGARAAGVQVHDALAVHCVCERDYAPWVGYCLHMFLKLYEILGIFSLYTDIPGLEHDGGNVD